MRALRIPRSLNRVLAAIQFDDELTAGAAEIDHESVDRHLPLELPSAESSIAKPEPERTLGIRL
ncbi:MAG: hypothetical protein NTAFB05_30210 [Nitrobacter sp.]